MAGMVDQEEVTTVIATRRAVARGDDAVAAEATVRLARRTGPDAVRFLRRVIVTDGGWASVAQRVRASCAVLEVAGHLGGYSAETRSIAAFEEPKGVDGAGEREGT
jgi:hypothetical protein